MYQIIIEPIYFWSLIAFLLVMYAGTALVLYLHFTGGISFKKAIEKLLDEYLDLVDKKLKEYSVSDFEKIREYIESRIQSVEQFESEHFERIEKISKLQREIMEDIRKLHREITNKDQMISNLYQEYQNALESIKEKNGIIENKNNKINKLRKRIAELENEN